MSSDRIRMAVNEVMNQALHAALVRRERLVLVDSPPGAGKTWFCERLVAYAIGHAGLRVCYVAPKVDQGADMARRLVASRASFDLEVLTGKGRTRPTDIDPTVLWTSDATSVGAAGALLITNPQKLAQSMAEANRRRKLVRFLPSVKLVTRWIEHARKLTQKITY